MMYFYFHPAALRVPPNAGFGEMIPRLLFEDTLGNGAQAQESD
jgi:hypothetical protein